MFSVPSVASCNLGLVGLNTPPQTPRYPGMTIVPLDRAGSVDERRRFLSMLILRGSPALSPFRLQKLRQDLAAAGLAVRALYAEFVHLVELKAGAELTSAERRVLEQLLTYGPSRAAAK